MKGGYLGNKNELWFISVFILKSKLKNQRFKSWLYRLTSKRYNEQKISVPNGHLLS